MTSKDYSGGAGLPDPEVLRVRRPSVSEIEDLAERYVTALFRAARLASSDDEQSRAWSTQRKTEEALARAMYAADMDCVRGLGHKLTLLRYAGCPQISAPSVVLSAIGEYQGV